MDKEQEVKITTPLRWKMLLILLAVFLLLLYIEMTLGDIGSIKIRSKSQANFVAVGIGTVMFCFHHTITSKYLIVRFLGIPVRFIPWRDVTHAVYIHTWDGGSKRGKHIQHGQCIVVTLVGCPRYDPVHSIRSRFRWEHPIDCLFLRFPDERKDEFLTAFQAVFPNLELQKESNAKNKN